MSLENDFLAFLSLFGLVKQIHTSEKPYFKDFQTQDFPFIFRYIQPISSALKTPYRLLSSNHEFKISQAEIGKEVFFVWEDLWEYKTEIIQSKLRHIFAQSPQRMHARDLNSCELEVDEAKCFLNTHQMYGFAKAKTHIGLRNQKTNALLAVASFAEPRMLDRRALPVKSSELVRICMHKDVHISGGMSKLIRTYLKLHPISHLMTYVDLDWSSGNAFSRNGWKFENYTIPLFFGVENRERYIINRPELAAKFDLFVFNSGNKKMVLEI